MVHLRLVDTSEPDAPPALAQPSVESLDCTVGSVVQPLPTLTPLSRGQDAFQLLMANPHAALLAVIDQGRVVGAVDRVAMLSQFARPLQRDVYERRPVTLIMDPDPLLADADLPVDGVVERILHEKPDAIASGLVVIKDGFYLGVAGTLDVVRRSAELARLRAGELEIARAAAEEASRAKSRFLANMSHELRTPLNAVIGFSDVIARQMLGPIGTARYAEYANDIRSGGELLLRLINEILDLAKVGEGRMVLAEEDIDLAETVARCLRLMAGNAAAQQLGLTARLPLEPVRLRADPVKLQQMLLNLLGNACKFTKPGGSVTITAERRAGMLWIEVADTGIGIPQAELERVLEPFTQVENEMTRRHAGTGLGLPLTRELARLHGGDMVIASEPGRGTRATITLPGWRVSQA